MNEKLSYLVVDGMKMEAENYAKYIFKVSNLKMYTLYLAIIHGINKKKTTKDM